MIVNLQYEKMISYIDLDGNVVSTSAPITSIIKECCVPCSTVVLRRGLWLCDYPMVEDHGLTRLVHKTCDAMLCNAHAYKIAEQVPMKDSAGDFVDDVHVCPAHYEEWVRLGKPEFWKK